MYCWHVRPKTTCKASSSKDEKSCATVFPPGSTIPALVAELASQAASASGDIAAFRPLLHRYHDAIRAYFAAGRHKQVSA